MSCVHVFVHDVLPIFVLISTIVAIILINDSSSSLVLFFQTMFRVLQCGTTFEYVALSGSQSEDWDLNRVARLFCCQIFAEIENNIEVMGTFLLISHALHTHRQCAGGGSSHHKVTSFCNRSSRPLLASRENTTVWSK